MEYGWDMFRCYIQSHLELLNRVIILPCILIRKTLTVKEFRVARHELYCFIKVIMCFFVLPHGEVCVSSIVMDFGI